MDHKKQQETQCQHKAIIRTTEQVKPGEPIVRIVWRCAKCDEEFIMASHLRRAENDFKYNKVSFESQAWNNAVEMCMRMINPGYWLIYTGPGGYAEPILLKAMKRLQSIKQQDIMTFPGHMWSDVHKRNMNIVAGRKLCEKCGGTGNEVYSMYRKCSECGGAGHIPRSKEEQKTWDRTQEDMMKQQPEKSDEPDICPDAPLASDAPEPETSEKEPDGARNTFGVFAYQPGANAQEGVVVGRPVNNFIPREDALNLAAWLAVFADPTQKEFPALLKKVVDMGNE